MLDHLTFFNIILCHRQAVLDMQLYEKALDVFEDDPATSVSYYSLCASFSQDRLLLNMLAAFTYGPFFTCFLQGILHKHLLRTMGTPIVDKILSSLVTSISSHSGVACKIIIHK